VIQPSSSAPGELLSKDCRALHAWIHQKIREARRIESISFVIWTERAIDADVAPGDS
jgi:hypothetical protein